jgi:hypothetical protein
MKFCSESRIWFQVRLQAYRSLSLSCASLLSLSSARSGGSKIEEDEGYEWDLIRSRPVAVDGLLGKKRSKHHGIHSALSINIYIYRYIYLYSIMMCSRKKYTPVGCIVCVHVCGCTKSWCWHFLSMSIKNNMNHKQHATLFRFFANGVCIWDN